MWVGEVQETERGHLGRSLVLHGLSILGVDWYVLCLYPFVRSNPVGSEREVALPSRARSRADRVRDGRQ